MSAKQNLAEPLSCQKSWLRPTQLDFFEFLAALALELGFGKRRFARKFVDHAQQRLGELGKPGKGNRTGVRTRAGSEVCADAPKIFFDLPAGSLRGSGSRNRRGDFRKPRPAIDGRYVAGTEIQVAMKFRNSVRLDENDFEAIRETRSRPLRPRDLPFGGERRDGIIYFDRSGRHYAASFSSTGTPGATGRRKTMARFSLSRYFFAAASTSSRFTARNPSRIAFTSCGSLSNSVKQASRCISP